jgi:hypothetical protein
MTTRIPVLGAMLAIGLTASCVRPDVLLPPPPTVPLAAPGDVERVLFLIGDAGEARATHFPILPTLQRDIEWWTSHLESDSAVTVLFLGDNVYPLGLHAPGTPEYPGDSAVIMDQLSLLAGPAAVSRGAQGIFMAGNHDWGLKEEWEGFVRLKTMEDFLEMGRATTGAGVRLAPEAGTGGPEVVDVGRHVRLLILDTAWWLLDGGRLTAENQVDVLAGIEEAIASAGDREIFIAAHHPFRSAGPHGGEFNFWRTFGARYILARSGAILQDVTSLPYRKLEQGLRRIFERQGPPLVFIGGHEHSLQMFGPIQPTDPRYSIVSGAGSKTSSVGTADGIYFARDWPGYMRIVIEQDGGMSLFVIAVPPEFHECPTSEPERAECMEEGMAAFGTIYSFRLR